MNETRVLLPLIEKLFDHDLAAATHVFEGMGEEEAAEVLRSLPARLAVRVLRHLQVSYAAALLKSADDAFLHEITSQLDPRFAAAILMRLPANAREGVTKHFSGQLYEQAVGTRF